jgi:hypothetical protein
MESVLSKVFVVALIIFGEGVGIYAEIMGAKNDQASASGTFWPIFLKMFLLIALAGGILIIGYILGIRTFKNIWIVSAISITAILIIEPVIAWTMFHQKPTFGAAAGLVLGTIGLFMSIIF